MSIHMSIHYTHAYTHVYTHVYLCTCLYTGSSDFTLLASGLPKVRLMCIDMCLVRWAYL